jgi:hypothetical protein
MRSPAKSGCRWSGSSCWRNDEEASTPTFSRKKFPEPRENCWADSNSLAAKGFHVVPLGARVARNCGGRRLSSSGSATLVTCAALRHPSQWWTMRFWQEGIFFLVVSVLGALLLPPASTAQNRETAPVAYSQASKSPTHTGADRHAPALRTLTAGEGLAVISAALESRGNADAEADCSHLVHAIYERAGFPYSYESSSTLYAGSNEFRRVVHPQPGDLVVWPGHVGIAVNPGQHSFFSALRTGLGIDAYDSAYWRERGRPRFFRYVTDAPATDRVATSAQEGNLKTTASAESQPPSTRNIKFDSSTQPRLQTDSRNIVPAPRAKTVHSQHPTPSQIKDALEQMFHEAGEALRGEDLLNRSNAFFVFDQVSVERVHLQRDRGWAEIRLTGVVRVPQEKAHSAKRTERQRCLLFRRDPNTWEIAPSSEASYIPSEIVVRTLAHQLAALTEENAEPPVNPEEKVQLSRLLNALLEK